MSITPEQDAYARALADSHKQSCTRCLGRGANARGDACELCNGSGLIVVKPSIVHSPEWCAVYGAYLVKNYHNGKTSHDLIKQATHFANVFEENRLIFARREVAFPPKSDGEKKCSYCEHEHSMHDEKNGDCRFTFPSGHVCRCGEFTTGF